MTQDILRLDDQNPGDPDSPIAVPPEGSSGGQDDSGDPRPIPPEDDDQ